MNLQGPVSAIWPSNAYTPMAQGYARTACGPFEYRAYVDGLGKTRLLKGRRKARRASLAYPDNCSGIIGGSSASTEGSAFFSAARWRNPGPVTS